MMKHLHLAWLLAFCLATTSAFAQKPHTFTLWKGFALTQPIGKDWTIGARDQLRISDGLTQFAANNLNLDLTYSPKKWYAITGGYRYSIRRKTNQHRIYLDNSFRLKLGDTGLRLAGRVRFQANRPTDPADMWALDTRLRADVQYAHKKLKNWSFVLARAEFFFNMYGTDPAFFRYRLGAAAKCNLDDDVSLTLGYIFQNDLNAPATRYTHIANIEFNFTLPDLKKKDKKKDGDKKDNDNDGDKDKGKGKDKDKKSDKTAAPSAPETPDDSDN